MSWSSRRKFLILAFIGIFILVVIGGPAYYLFYRAPTCFDNKQNQNEEGVDCGGSCTRLCKAGEIAPIVLWQQAFPITSTVYTSVAYVENPNGMAEALNVPYVFREYGKNNNLVAEQKGVTTIPPGINFAVFETGIVATTSPIVRTSFEFTSDPVWQVPRYRSQLVVRNSILSNEAKFPSVDTSIVNNAPVAIGTIDVTAIIYDTKGNAFAASKTYIDGIAKNSSEHVVFTWPQPFTTAVSKIEIIPILR